MLESQNNDRLIIELLNQNEELKFKLDKVLSSVDGARSLDDLYNLELAIANQQLEEYDLLVEYRGDLSDSLSIFIVFFGVLLAFKVSDLFLKIAFKR